MGSCETVVESADGGSAGRRGRIACRGPRFAKPYRRDDGSLPGGLCPRRRCGCWLRRGAPEIDEGVDVTLTHTSDIHLRDDKKAHLEVQMKSSAYGPIENGQFVSTSLKRARYDEFRAVDVAVHKIIVILHMPVLQEDWLTVGADALHLHHRAYWVSIRGMPPIPNAQQASFTVRAPTVQVFDDITLCHIMQRIGQKGAP